MHNIITFYPFAKPDEFIEVAKHLQEAKFSYGAISTDTTLPIWKGELENSSVPAKIAMKSLGSKVTASFELVSCHINLQTFGLDGAFHTDSVDPAGTVSHALTWFVHPCEWPLEYGGFLLLGDNEHELRAVLPSRNCAILHDSHIPHCATAPMAKAIPHQRSSVSLKLRMTNAF